MGAGRDADNGMVERNGLRTLTFDNRAMALGLAVEHLMTKPAFGRLPFGHWGRILTGQIRRGHYFFVADSKRIVGFCGWALASEAEAEAWMTGRPEAAHIVGDTGDCMVLNAWSADTPEAHQIVREELRIRGRGSRMLYAKRDYKDGRVRPLRMTVAGSLASHAGQAASRNAD